VYFNNGKSAGYANALTSYNQALEAKEKRRTVAAGDLLGTAAEAATARGRMVFPAALLFDETEKPLHLKDRLRAFFKRNYNSKIAPPNYWQDPANRVAWVRELVAFTGKEPQRLAEDDFKSCGMERAYIVCGGIYCAVNEAYPELGIKAWEMIRTPKHFFDDKENRQVAVIANPISS